MEFRGKQIAALAFVAAALHVPTGPVATIASGFIVYAITRGPEPLPLSEEYTEVVSMTESRGNRHLWTGLLLATLIELANSTVHAYAARELAIWVR